MRTWDFDGKVNIDFEKSEALLVAAMLEPLQVMLKEAVTHMEYEAAEELIKKAKEIKRAVTLLQEGDKDESCGTDGKNN